MAATVIIFCSYINMVLILSLGFPGGTVVKNLPASAGGSRDAASIHPWVRKIPWTRTWQPTPAFLPGKFHEHRSPGRLPSMGSQMVRNSGTTEHSTILLLTHRTHTNSSGMEFDHFTDTEEVTWNFLSVQFKWSLVVIV